VQWVLAVVLSIHLLAAVFWTGSTFVMARTNGRGANLLLRPQLVAAIVTILSGAYLWHQLHEGSLERPEKILMGAAVSALVALIIQGWVVGHSLGALRRQAVDEAVARFRISVAYRVAAVLLAATVVGMAAARYA
jgi:hypothetical protein